MCGKLASKPALKKSNSTEIVNTTSSAELYLKASIKHALKCCPKQFDNTEI